MEHTTTKQKEKLILYAGLFFVLVGFVSPHIARAITDTTFGDNLSAEIEPQNPGSFTEVTFVLKSFATDLRGAEIKWVVNGKTITQGKGAVRAKLNTGAVGSKTTVTASVHTIENSAITKIMEIVPADVDVLWEADTYTPPLYRGKALPSPRANIRFVALPTFKTESGRKIEPKDLVYTWSRGGKTAGAQSGTGKNTASFVGAGPLGAMSVDLLVTTVDGVLRAEKTLSVENVTPRVLIYEERPLEGTRRETAIGASFGLSSDELTVRAEPYFFSNPQGLLAFRWVVGNEEAVLDETPQLFTVRHERGKSGLAQITAAVRHRSLLFQQATQTTTVTF